MKTKTEKNRVRKPQEPSPAERPAEGAVSRTLFIQATQALDAVLAFGPEHVSAYQLTIEPGTPFARAAARGQLALADEDEGAAMLERLAARLAAGGRR